MTGFISELYRELLDRSIFFVCGDSYQVNGRGKRTRSNPIRLYFEKKEGVPKILDLAGHPPITVKKRYCSESGMAKDTLVPSWTSL